MKHARSKTTGIRQPPPNGIIDTEGFKDLQSQHQSRQSREKPLLANLFLPAEQTLGHLCEDAGSAPHCRAWPSSAPAALPGTCAAHSDPSASGISWGLPSAHLSYSEPSNRNVRGPENQLHATFIHHVTQLQIPTWETNTFTSFGLFFDQLYAQLADLSLKSVWL